MKFEDKVGLCRHYQYMNTGLWLTTYVKYLIAFFGLASRDVEMTIIIGLAYVVVAYVLGLLWFKLHWFEAYSEVSARHTKFVKEMRERIGCSTGKR